MPLSSRVIKGKNIKFREDIISLPLITVAKKMDNSRKPLPKGTRRQAEPHAGEEKPAEARQQAEEILETARKAGEAITAEARAEHKRLLAEAEAECKEIKENAYRIAYEEGLESGRRQGLAEGRREAEKLRAKADELLKEARILRKKMLERAEPQLVKLAVAIAEKIIRREINHKPEIIAGMVHSALQQLQEKGEIIIRLHPEDGVFCREQLAEWQQEMGKETTLTLLADGSMERGTYRVETENSVIECRAKERLAELQRILMDVTADD